MHKPATTLFSLILISSSPVFAGAGSDHEHGHAHAHTPMTSDEAAAKATAKVKELVANGKLEKSWGEVSPPQVEQKTFAKGPEWVAVFKNTGIADPSKQTLYLFYSVDGHYLATNFTGK